VGLGLRIGIAAILVIALATVVIRVDIGSWSLLSLTLRVGVAVAAIVAFVTAILWRGRWWRHVLFGVIAFALTVGVVALQVNAHYRYLPQVKDLFGHRAATEASAEGAVRDGKLPPTGKTIELEIPGTKSGFKARPAEIYLPPAWFRDTDRKLPVLYLMHGSPGYPVDWTRGGLADVTADQWAHAHNGIAPIIVMPDINGGLTEDTECVDSSRGNAETYLTQDVRQFVINRFGTATAPQQWAVAGLSEGGMCGLVLTLRHPDLFRTFGDYGGLSGPRSGEADDAAAAQRDLFGGSKTEFDNHEPSVLLQRKVPPGLSGWFEVAHGDGGALAAANKVEPLSKKAGIDTCFVIIQGGSHNFGVFAQSFRDSLPWIAARLGLVPKSPSQTTLCRN
jgi:S-formylglutathione hydrolase FrmB